MAPIVVTTVVVVIIVFAHVNTITGFYNDGSITVVIIGITRVAVLVRRTTCERKRERTTQEN